FYVIGLAYGLADFSSLAGTLWLLSMTAGAAAARLSVLPAMLVAVAIFVIFNITLERLLGSWLERLMARGRSRELFLGIFVLLMISVQFIVPFLERHDAALREWTDRALPYFAFLPPSLAGRAVAGSAQHDIAAVLVGFGGLLAYVVLFSGL